MARSLMRMLLGMLLLVLPDPGGAARAQAACGEPTQLDDGWVLATPAEVGLDPARLCTLDAVLAEWPKANVHAVVVVRRGRLAFERYFTGEDERWGDRLGPVAFGPAVKHDLRSISKSVTSLLIGIALGEGRYPVLDSPVLGSFPEYAALATPEKRRITLRDLLTMSSGLAWDESRAWDDPGNDETGMILAADPFRYILSRPVVHPPGTVYAYSGGATSLLGEVLIRSTGRPLADYARDKLFTPLQIADFEWLEAGVSHRLGAFGSLRLRPRDAAKIGHLLLRDGQWNGRPVVPAGWTAEVTRPRLNGEGLFFYGYQWWLGRSLVDGRTVDWIAGVGLGGQRLYVVPALDLVVMITAGYYRGGPQGALPAAVLNRVVLPAVRDSP